MLSHVLINFGKKNICACLVEEKMFITEILVSIWIILFNRDYIYQLSIIFIVGFMMEIYVNFISISNYYWLDRNQNQSIFWFLQNRWILSKESTVKLSTIQLQNPIRRLMFLKIQNLFQTTELNSIDHRYSFFNYRCPICLNNKLDSFRWIALGCGHILCSFCLQHLYFGNKPICPTCRSSIILSDLTILYI